MERNNKWTYHLYCLGMLLFHAHNVHGPIAVWIRNTWRIRFCHLDVQTPQMSMGQDRTATRPPSAGGIQGEGMPEQARQQPPGQPGLPKEAPRSAQPGPPTAPSVTIDEARQRALDAILKVCTGLRAA